jgi:hypothetical protein
MRDLRPDFLALSKIEEELLLSKLEAVSNCLRSQGV